MRSKILITLIGVGALLQTGAAVAGPYGFAAPDPAMLSLLAGGVGVLAAVRYLRRK